MYITKEQAQNAIQNMQLFSKELDDLFAKHGMSFEGNTGRRNVLLSQAQEHFLAQELKKSFPSTRNDGRTGEPDISISEIGKVVECKLTTPSKNGALTLQSDKEAFSDGEKDFIYFVADDKMQKFAVLHFIGLTRDDFGASSESSRGRVKMIKSASYKKCIVLHGEYEPRSKKMIDAIDQKLLRSRKGTKAYQNLLKSKLFWENSNESFTLNLHAIENNLIVSDT